MTDMETVPSNDVSNRPKPTLSLVGVCVLSAIMCATVTLPEGAGWTTPLLVIVPGILTAVVIRSSIISAAYLAQVTLYFGITTLILGTQWEPRLISAVLAWSLALAVGTLAGGLSARRTLRRSSSRPGPRLPHYALCSVLIGVNAFLVLSSRSGYAAQLTNGVSTPTGILGTLSSVAPIITLTLLFNSIGSDRRSRVAIILATVQAFVLALSGFRGAGGVFIVSILVGAALTLPLGSAWMRKSRLLVVLPSLLLLVVSTLLLGAGIKNSAASELGVSSSGTELFTLNNALRNTSIRLQLGSSLDTAIKYRDSSVAKEAVSWKDQLGAAAPRLLWPGKPRVDYGQRVSVAMYGLTYGQSSSTVTTIGDSILNYGLGGMVLAGLLAGYAVSRFEGWVQRGVTGLSLLLAAVVVYSTVGQEQPILLILVGIVRDGLVAGALWVAATVVADLMRSNSPRSPTQRGSCDVVVGG